jgi:hypothetical protein
MPHSTNLTFDLVELAWPEMVQLLDEADEVTELGYGYRRDRINRRVVERHIVSGVTAIDPEVRPGPVGFNRTHAELLRLRLLA